jgi:tetratricopeptide (TPR) repeat protein
MSLLLDALKKAAQEKHNADSSDINEEAGAELGLQQVADAAQQQEKSGPVDFVAVEELDLVLDSDEPVLSVSPPVDLASGITQESSRSDQDRRITPTPSTVTDEALQLLIHKTNNEHKKSRMLSWGGVVTGSLILLSMSGLYFYFNMINEIETMQRKHQIALATLKSKTRIEENLTSLAVTPEVEKQKQSSVQSAEKAGNSTNTSLNKLSESAGNQQAFKAISVQRADKRDPVGEVLERGWNAYQNEDYELSKSEYEKVLKDEPDNHDALLGLAAVSMQQNHVESARDIYIKLLERDPRDPHAHAGLANIAQTTGASLSEAKLKQLIEYRPEDSHLQFALGNVYVQKKSWPEAQQAFFNAWKADSNNPDYAYNLAVSLDQLGKHSEAKAYYEDSLKLAAGKNISFSSDAVKDRLVYLARISRQGL